MSSQSHDDSSPVEQENINTILVDEIEGGDASKECGEGVPNESPAYEEEVHESMDTTPVSNEDIPEDPETSEEDQELGEASEPLCIPSLLEALLFCSKEPLSLKKLQEVTALPKQEILDGMSDLQHLISEREGGVELVEVAGGYQLRSRAAFSEQVIRLLGEKPKRLSKSALETLAIIAYKQPITRSTIEDLRGVNATPALKSLLEWNLIKIFGYQKSVGTPALYGTSEEFLKVFGLNDLSSLPTIRDITTFEKDPGESLESIENPLHKEQEAI